MKSRVYLRRGRWQHLCRCWISQLETISESSFHEITPRYHNNAIKSTNEQWIWIWIQAATSQSKILDRLVGFELSPVAWQKVPGGKSAGRVQSQRWLLVGWERELWSWGQFCSKLLPFYSRQSNSRPNLIKFILHRKADKQVSSKQSKRQFIVSDI